MELSWLRGKSVSDDEVKRWEATLVGMGNAASFYSDFLFWREATRTAIGYIADFTPITPVKLMLAGDWHGASLAWEKIGCPYERAIMLMRGDEKHQKVGLSILDELGAVATANRFRLELKSKGVRNIPSGPRESTLNNPAKLTDRQIDILILLGKGLPNKEIGEKLFISPKTVDNHISAILSKLGVNSRAKAVVESQRLGIVKHE
jgi:DNA-binding CsgD family transcriptional regulator